MNIEKLKNEYEDNLTEFKKVSEEVYATLNRIVGIFFDKYKFHAYVQKPRLKSFDSIINKMKKKQIESDSLFLTDTGKVSMIVNDFLGARIICNTIDDVTEIQKMILENLRFKVEKEDSITKKSGYRALHLDLQYEVHFNDQLVSFPLEIQIKTQLQHAWAEITHDESYKPEIDDWSNEWEVEYSKHMADILDSLDKMARTIRKQRIAKVHPPTTIDENNTIINSDTLTFKISQHYGGAQLTKQEIGIVLNRLKELNIYTLAELASLFNSSEVRMAIQDYKKSLGININVTPYDILYFGSAILKKNGNTVIDEMRSQYGFVDSICIHCKKLLKKEEYEFMKKQTDADDEYYCEEHRILVYNNKCPKCGLFTKQIMCKNCEASESLI
jgi:ppGpp synthetase/RelA/SpoT-type nucleotidyltranferase